MTAMHFVISTGISSNMTIPIPHQDGDLSGWNFSDSALQLVVKEFFYRFRESRLRCVHGEEGENNLAT